MRRAVTLLVAVAIAGCTHLHLTSEARREAHERATPCCRLTGRWEVNLTLDSAREGGVAGVRQLTAGSVTLGDSVSPQARWLLRGRTGHVREELGVSAIDLSPMLGASFRPGALIRELRSIGATDVDSTMETTTLATAFPGDSVEMDFMPQIDHFGILLYGRIRGDSIVGRWIQKRFCCGAYGRFVLRRAQ